MVDPKILENDIILAEIVRRLIQDFHPTRVFLFGSRARGDEKEGSDYDLLVVLENITGPAFRLAQMAHRHTLQGISVPVDIVMISESQFEAKKTVIGTLPEAAIHEGKELYAA